MDQTLIEVVKIGDLGRAGSLLTSGADVNQSDNQGWTPLNFAAGKGDLSMVKLLIERGADSFKVGLDNRTPYMIALAAGRVDVAKYLREVEDKTGLEKAESSRQEHKYCKAYPLKDMRAYPGWSEGKINWNEKRDAQSEDGDFTDEKVVFIHQNYTVTESIWINENVIFNQVSDEWREFCSKVIGFKVPTDLDLIGAASGEN